MAEERVDIVITDKVDADIAAKINQIADSAERGQTYIARLQQALNNVNASAMDRLASAMAKVDSAQARLISAQARLTNAQNAGGVAAARIALTQQKVATETARTEAATSRAAAASSAAESAALRLAATQERLGATAAAAGNAEEQLANDIATLNARVASGEGGIRQLVQAHQQQAAAANGAANATQNATNQTNNAANAAGRYNRAQRQVNAANANIIAQIQDIGVSLAGGQDPLLVAIQQGSQLSYIASTMQGGVRGLITQVARLALAWAPVIAAFGAAYFALKRFTDGLNQGSDIDGYIQSLGLTDRELRKLEDTHITVGDTISATWQVLSENLLASMGITTEELAAGWQRFSNKMLLFMKAAFIGIGALTVTFVRTTMELVGAIPAIFYNAGVGAKNAFLMSIEFLVNKTIGALNGLAGIVNVFSRAAGFGNVVDTLSEIDLGVQSIGQGMVDIDITNPMDHFREAAQNSLDTIERIGERADQLRRDRLRDQANEIIADRTPRAGPRARNPREQGMTDEERRELALARVNAQLDNELSRMRMLKSERDVQQRMDTITEQLLSKRITLTDAESAAIRGKVQAIEAYGRVQAQMDRIYEEVTGPARDYADTLAAITDLHQRGAITAEQLTRQVNLATRAMQEATNPLFALEEAMTTAESTTRLYGVALEQANYYESIRQAMLEKGVVLSQSYIAGLNSEVDALMRRNDALIQSQYIQSQASGFINPALDQARFLTNYQAIYDEIERMRQGDLANEDAYQQALYALQAQYSEARLSAYSNFFGTLAGIASRGHGAIGAIGKAAAVAQATIDGYLAVQKALASAPPPFNFVAAAAVAMQTGANVAGILSTNAGSFANGGQFMVEGRSGVDSNNINMNVSRGERVTVETPAQQRANDNASGGTVEHKTLVFNYFDQAEFEAAVAAAMGSDQGEQVIVNKIRLNENSGTGAR